MGKFCSDEFKARMVQQFQNEKCSFAELGRRWGISAQSISRWVKEAKRAQSIADDKTSSSSLKTNAEIEGEEKKNLSESEPLAQEAEKALKQKKHLALLAERKRTKRKRLDNLLSFLIQAYPNCFSERQKKPLKIGIKEDLFERHPDQSKKIIRDFLEDYTYPFNYQVALAKQTHRYDLAGNPVSEVTPDQKAKAEAMVKKILKARRGHAQKKEAQEKILKGEHVLESKEHATDNNT